MYSNKVIAVPGITRALAWCGEVIAANVEDVFSITMDHVQAFIANGSTLIVIDLTRLRFIDSSGAAVMLRILRRAGEKGGQVLYCNVGSGVSDTLRNVGIDQLLLNGAQ